MMVCCELLYREVEVGLERIDGFYRCVQMGSLRRLEQDNQEAAARLEEVVHRGEALLEKIQEALADIAQSQLEIQNSLAEPPNSSAEPPKKIPTFE